jgi:hypothetical protein
VAPHSTPGYLLKLAGYPSPEMNRWSSNKSNLDRVARDDS